MSKEIREFIEKIKSINHFVNEDTNSTPTEFRFGIGVNHKSSSSDVSNYRKIGELLSKKTPISVKYFDGDSPMARPICMGKITPSEKSKEVVNYECIPQIKTKDNLKTIRDSDTINGSIQIIQRYAESIYNNKAE